MLKSAVVSAEVSLPERPDAAAVRERVAILSDVADVVGLTDNHAGQARMSPLAAVALARELGVATVVHVSCRDRNRLALRSQVVGAAALGSDGVLCLYGDPTGEVPRVRDLTATELIAEAKGWAQPQEIAVGAVVNPFADDLDREVRLLEKKIRAGATFIQSQMIFDLDALAGFLDRACDLLADVQFQAGVALLRDERMARRARSLPGCVIPDETYARIASGDGIVVAHELATQLAGVPGVDALHIFPLGAERATCDVASAFRVARGLTATRS